MCAGVVVVRVVVVRVVVALARWRLVVLRALGAWASR
jgi:hypothetical protein